MAIGSIIAGGLNTFLNPLGSFLGKVGSGIGKFFGSDLFGTGYSIGQDIFNIYQQEQQNERTMALQRELWERDDNSLTRLMKQYQENGINPLLAVPNVSQGNTKGFETSAIQSKIAYEQERMAREQYKLNKERQELELDVMRNQNRRAEELHQEEVAEKGLNNSLLRAKVKGAKAYAKTYGGAYGDDFFGEDGYIPPYSLSFQEKLIEAGFSLLENLLEKNGTPEPSSLFYPDLPPEIINDKSIKKSIISPNTLTYGKRKFYYNPDKGTYTFEGHEYKQLNTVKYMIDYINNEQPRHDVETKNKKDMETFENEYLLPSEYYEPMYMSN